MKNTPFYLVMALVSGLAMISSCEGGGNAVERLCADGLDNDADGRIDCADSDCAAAPSCSGTCNYNGLCEAGENPASCPTDCSGPVCGNGTCETGETNANCPQDCPVGPVCGNGTCETGETNANCPQDCPVGPLCGNAVVDAGEDCDCGTNPDQVPAGCVSENSDTRPDACRTNCENPACGDGVTDTGEQCDDAGESADCDADCTPATCGDSTVNTTAGETCDHGGESATCDDDCTSVVCGDGNVNETAGEECDDGNVQSGDGCDSSCVAEECSATITTTFYSDNSSDGNMFDIVALGNIIIDSFDVNLESGTHTVEIWHRSGSYVGHTTSSTGWTQVASVTGVVSAGTDWPTSLGLNLHINVASGQTAAFYITTTSSSLNMNYTNGTTEGAVYTSNSDLQILEGIGLSYPFSTSYSPRVWNGNIVYCP